MSSCSGSSPVHFRGFSVRLITCAFQRIQRGSLPPKRFSSSQKPRRADQRAGEQGGPPCFQGLVLGRRAKAASSGFFSDNLLVRIHLIIVMIRWTGLASWEFQFPFPGSVTSTFLGFGVGPPGRRAKAASSGSDSSWPNPHTPHPTPNPSPSSTVCAAREALKVLKTLSPPSPTKPPTLCSPSDARNRI